jgi:hypothetical protein
MRLADIPFQCFFRREQDDPVEGTVYLKPNFPSKVVSHVRCINTSTDKEIYLANDMQVTIVDKISNFD